VSRMTRDQVRRVGRAACWRPAGLAGALPIVALAGGAVGLVLLARLVLGAPAAAQSAGNRPAGAGDPRLIVQPRTITQVARIAGLRLALTASPLVPGPNRVVVTLDEQGRAVEGARVHLVATMSGMPMRPVRFVAGQERDGRYTAAGALPMFGRWQLTVRVDRPHAAPIVQRFWLRLDLPPALLQEVGARGASDAASHQ
jgi:YtkA-like